MNRPLIITAGIVIILLMVALWVYLLAYGAPEKPREVFSNLGFLAPQAQEVRTIDPSSESNPGVQLSLSGSSLQQLTTRSVAGFAFLKGSDSVLRYVEQGTGHVFEIDLEKGIEKQITVTTIPQASEAVFSPDGTSVAITIFDGYTRDTVLGTFEGENELVLAHLPEGVENIEYKDDRTLYFSIRTEQETRAYAYNIAAQTSALVAVIPFGSARVVWGNSPKMYTYPFASDRIAGAVYEVSGGSLIPQTEPQLQTAAFAGKEGLISSSLTEEGFTSTAHINGKNVPLKIAMAPEKCVFAPHGNYGVWCAVPVEDGYDLAKWYKGTTVTSDQLWLTNIESGVSISMNGLKELAGRTVDVDGMEINDKGSLLLLRNKVDGALWLYRVPQP